jgi:hypothetical protein
MLPNRSLGLAAGKADVAVGRHFIVERGVSLPTVVGAALVEG